MRKGELEKDTDKMMREYRAQLDAERARKLSQGRNHSRSATKSDRKRGPNSTHNSFYSTHLSYFYLYILVQTFIVLSCTDKKDRESKRPKRSSKKRKVLKYCWL